MAKSPTPTPPRTPTPRETRAAPVAKARIVVTTTITHVPPRGEPTSLAVGTARNCKSDELPYRRPSGSFVVGAEWRPLDLGWLGEGDENESGEGAVVGQVALYNTEGTTLEKIPTPEEREAINRRVVEVAVRDCAGDPIPVLLVRPGDVFRGEPTDAGKLIFRCQDPAQKVRCDLVVFHG